MNEEFIAIGLMVFFLALILITFYFGVHRKGRRAFIFGLYIMAFVYVAFQGMYFVKTLPGYSPDESAHISYIYYLNKTDKLIPDFEDMDIFNDEPMKWSVDYYALPEQSVNYLCHPPLYYQIMRLAGGFTDTEDPLAVQIDKNRLRLSSSFISSIGVILLLYIGWSRITHKKPWLHLMYCTAATSVPMLGFEFAGVTNDSLALVTSCICIIGLIRFSEKKRGYITYTLIAVGITASLLTKMTAALLCILMALIILGFSMIRERSFFGCLKYEFWVTSPIYLIAIAYYIYIYNKYGVIQPSLELISTQEYFQSTIYYTDPAQRINYTLMGYCQYYLNKFFLSWSGIEAARSFMKLTPFSKATLPCELLWIFPVLLVIPRARQKAGRLSLPVFAGWVSCVITFAIQMKSAYGTYLTRGYMGGFQSRYYLPFLFAFGMGAVFVFQSALVDSGFDEDTEITTVKDISSWARSTLNNNLVYLMALGYIFLLFYGNFPFFLMHFTE